MNKDFSERISSLRKAFGIKEIVEDSILSDFKNQNPQEVKDADSSESTKEIEKARDSILEVNKAEGIESMMNFADKDDKDLDSNDHKKFYDTYIKLLLKADTDEQFNNFKNAAQDSGLANRLMADKESQSKIEHADDKSSEVKKFRKDFLDLIKKTKENYEKTYDDLIKSVKDQYIAKSVHYKGDLEKVIIAIKYMILSGKAGSDDRSKVELNKIIAHNPGLIRELVDDKEFINELKNRMKNAKEDKGTSNFSENLVKLFSATIKENFEDNIPEYAKKIIEAKDLDEFIKSLEDAVKSDDVKNIKDDGYNDLIVDKDESKSKDKKDIINKYYKSSDDKKKEIENAVKEYEGKKISTKLGDYIISYVVKKLEDAKKSGIDLSKDDSDLIRNKLAKKVQERLAKTQRNLKLFDGLIEGVEEPGKSFLKSILGAISTNAGMKAATDMDMIESDVEKAAKKLNSEAITLNEDDELSLDAEVPTNKEDAKKLSEKLISDLPDSIKKDLDKEEKVTKEEEKEITSSIPNFPKKPTKDQYPDKEQYKIAMDLYNDALKTIKTSGLIKDKGSLKKLKIEEGVGFIEGLKQVYSGIKIVASDMKDGTKDFIKLAGGTAKELGTAFSNSSEGIKAMGNAIKDSLDGAGKAGKDLLDGAGDAVSDLTESIGEAIKKAGDTDMTPEQIAAEAEKICKEKNSELSSKINWKKAEEALKTEKFMNNLKKSIEKAKSKIDKDKLKSDADKGKDSKSAEHKDKKSDEEASEPKKDSESEEYKNTGTENFSIEDPMESIIEGHVDTVSSKNFSLTKEFKSYEDSLNKLWDFN